MGLDDCHDRGELILLVIVLGTESGPALIPSDNDENVVKLLNLKHNFVNRIDNLVNSWTCFVAACLCDSNPQGPCG